LFALFYPLFLAAAPDACGAKALVKHDHHAFDNL
jgi:hypothetical protein